ncbi:hypothetical protein LWC34_09320 [Kibdelosporangium philippinense]|uniref:Tetratricopeptide repeat-containing protein n=1 Tax=Kibdelosporangium philippinense TaxID=211113 RepID=A0ABS8Z8A1_9PSEU|nr:hypothetical protein [Kibdelosporangium philippinense]MCE7003025.1 hypothetical protein [Kibdelosporangium philippinense]
MRRLRTWWHRLRGWWFLVVAAAVTGVMSAVSKQYTGLVAAIVVAVGGACAAVLSERGRAQLASPAAKKRSPFYLSRVDRITDPIRLGVHPAATVERTDGTSDRVPPFIERDRSPELAAALQAGGFVLVVGDSTAGKTRLAYETMRVCLPRHVCVVPDNPAAFGAAVAAVKQNRPSVLWLDDLERYLGADGLHRAEIDDVLDGKRGRTIVLATLRAHEREWFSERNDSGREHGERQWAGTARAVLNAVTSEIHLERRWSDRELASAQAFHGDVRVRRALASADRYGLAEHLAAGPELLRELTNAWSVRTGRARGAALVTAAVDIRRIKYHRPVPLSLLRDLHEAYLTDRGGVALRPEDWDEALDWATQPLHATSSLLEPHPGDEYLAFDYLVDAAAKASAPARVLDATWQAVVDVAAAAELFDVGRAAAFEGRFDYVQQALTKATSSNEFRIAADLAACLGDGGYEDTASTQLETIIAAARESGAVSAAELLDMMSDLAWMIGEKVAGRGDPERALRITDQIVRDTTALLGSDHPQTLHARLVHARQLGATGAEREALALATETAAAAVARYGRSHRQVLSARFEIAVWVHGIEGPLASVQHFTDLMADAERSTPVDRALIVDCRWNLGGALLACGDAAAVEVLATTVVEAQNVYGADHRRTLDKRLSHAEAVGVMGDPGRAAALAAQLVDDCVRHLGEDNPVTVEARALAERFSSAV